MKKLVIVLTLLLMATIAFALPAELSSKGNPALFKQLETKAKANLKKLPAAQKQAYTKLLKQHSDVIMAYLLAYESDANLACAQPEDVYGNYQTITDLLNSEGLRYKPEFFLSYIAKQTVSDEAITPYRKAMLADGLQDVIDTTKTDLDRFRATTLWCVSRLQFQQTSGRDQSPLDITQRSLIGRCEEMQILFVAAARTVGLPSRPASTPWWAHMDNNHAWAEVFLDGAWHYTGDMDAAWFPDQTWFSGMIDKTVLLLADGSLASENDEILFTGKYDTLINSTRNYAKERSRTISLQVVNELGAPVPEANIFPMVFNWGSLRAITAMNANKDGKLQFTAGRGAFFVSVFYKGQKALHYIPSDSNERYTAKLVLNKNSLQGDTFILDYPSNPMVWDKQPDAYRAAVQTQKELWQQKVKAFEAEATKPRDFADSLYYEVAKACRGNNPAFWQFAGLNQPIHPEFLQFLLIGDPKFLWQAKNEQFEALYLNWLSFDQDEYDEETRLSLYSSSVFYEELPRPVDYKNSKAQLYPAALRFNGMPGREEIISILAKLKKRYKINSTKALSGLIPLDVALKQKFLSSVQYRILACSILRANGYPTEFSRIPDLISVYIVDDWQYVNVAKLSWEDMTSSNETQNYILTLKIEDENGFPLQVDEEQLTLCRYDNGYFYPVNNGFKYLGSGKYRGEFPAVEAYLQFGFRISDSQTSFYYAPVEAKAADSLHITIMTKQYPHSWKAAEAEILALLDDTNLNNPEFIIIGNADQENSRRIADKLEGLHKEYLWFGHSNSENKNYQMLPAWRKLIAANPSYAMRTITLRKINGSWQMFEGLWDKLPE